MRLESRISGFRRLKDVLVGQKAAMPARISQCSGLFHSFRRVRSWLAKATGRHSAGNIAAQDVQVIVDSGVFDKAWYRFKYGHAIQPGMDPITHYLRHGIQAGHDPSPRFNTRWYLQRYPDVRKSGRNPLVHYLRWGRDERRLPLPDDLWLSQYELWSRQDPLPTSDAHGNLDDFSDGIISGWATGRRDGEPVEVEILVNDIPYKRVRADRARADIEVLGGTEAAVGFSVPIDIEQFDARLLHFSARIPNGGNPLGSWLPPMQLPGPATLRHRAVRPLPLPSRATIIIPVFNAPAETKACVEAVLENLPPWAELIISDDASTDAAINPLLGSLEGLERVRIVRKSENVGYTVNINDTIRLVSASDVVLLNSDTLVPPNWLRLLQRAAYSEDRVGTVTGLSDNAGAFSAPAPGLKNHPPAWHGAEEFSRLVTSASRRVYPVVPTGSGFCLYIRRDLINAIGLFDQEAFPRGYGVENDFCMRAQEAGWKNIVADDVYVRRARSASLSETKCELNARGVATVSERYPKYLREMRTAFTDSDEFCGVRYRIADSSLHRPDTARPRILFVLGVDSGGTPETNLDLMDSIQSEFEPILFLSDTRKGRVFRMIGRTKHALDEFRLQEALTPATHDSPEYAMHVARILDDHAIEAVHIRHLGRHGLSIIEGAKAKGIPVILSFHDFYTVCPNVKLVDTAGRHCRGVCTSGDIADCNVELWEPGEVGFPPLRHGWVRNWQARMAAALDSADHFVTSSSRARDLITSIYPRTGQKPFDVIEHGRDFPEFKSLAAPLGKGEPLRILLPGILVPAKGLELVRAIKALDTENQIEFHFLGRAVAPLDDLGVSHGKYVREKFAEHVEKIRPHIGAILSVWPETYSHTLTEMWACGLPVVVTPFGAQEERVARHGGGWILSDLDPTAVYAQLCQIAVDLHGLSDKLGHVVRWQSEYGGTYGVEAMSLRYRQLYREMLRNAARHPSAVTAQKIVYALHSDPERSAHKRFGTAHTLPFLREQLGSKNVVIESISHPTLRALAHLPEPAAILVQCDGTGRLDKETLALLRGVGRDKGREWKLFVEICRGPQAALDVTSDDSVLIDAADQVVSTGLEDGGSLTGAPASVPAGVKPARQALTCASINVDAVAAAMASSDVLKSSEIHSHNEPFVVAGQVQINWPRLQALAAARRRDRVSIIIPVFNVLPVTKLCLETITAETAYHDYEIILIDNGSEPEVAAGLDKIVSETPRTRLIRNRTNLMFATGSNIGGASSTGEFVVFLNNDIEVISPHWLDDLVKPLRVDATVGIVGGKLLYPNRTVQHAGIVFGEASSFPYHIYKGDKAQDPAVNRMRKFRAITGACMAMRASDFIKLRGFDPVFVNGSEDVDICFRMDVLLRRSCLYVPTVELIHHEGKSPGRGKHNLQNRRTLVDRWRWTIVADDRRYYRADGIQLMGYLQVDDDTVPPDIRDMRPQFAAVG